MNNAGRRTRWMLLGLILMTGCMSTDSLYEGVRASRRTAFREWQHQRQAEKASETRLNGKLSLQDSLKVALVHNKRLQATLQEKEVARGTVLESYSTALPKVTASAGYTRLDEVGAFDVGGQQISLGFVNNYSAGLLVSQPLFRGGAISAQLRAAQLAACLSDESVRGQVQQTIYDAARAYYDALLAQQLFKVNEEAVKSAEAHLEDVKRKRGQGVASEFDVLRAQVDVSNFRAEMIQQQNRIHLAKTSLLRVLGVSQQSEVELSEELAYAPMKPVLEEAVRLAHENRPDLYEAEIGVRVQQEALRIARSRYWPSVDAVFAQSWARPDPHVSTLDDWGGAWSAGVVASWPIFDGLAREGAVIREKAVLKRRNIELLDAQERALLEVQQAILSIRDAEEFVESQRLNLQRAGEGLRLAEVGYREGINTEVEVTDARAALTRARALYYQAVYDHSFARLDLQRAMGILGPRAGVKEVPKEPPARPSQIEEFAVPGAAPAEEQPPESAAAPGSPQGEQR